MPGIVPGAGDAAMNRIDQNPYHHAETVLVRTTETKIRYMET